MMNDELADAGVLNVRQQIHHYALRIIHFYIYGDN